MRVEKLNNLRDIFIAANLEATGLLGKSEIKILSKLFVTTNIDIKQLF
jgi:hypothetical protein